MNLKQKVLFGLGWSAGAKFLGQLITWAVTIIVMRLLTPGDYGLMGMAGVFIGLLSLINELGFGAALIQKQEIDENTLRQMFGMLLLINFFLFLVLLLIAPLIGSFFHEPRVVPIVRLLSTQFIINPFVIIPYSLLQREMDFKKMSIVEFIAALSGSGITLWLVLNGWGVWSLVWGSMTIIIIRTAGLNVVSLYLRIPIFSIKGMAQVITFGVMLLSVGSCGFFTHRRIFLSLEGFLARKCLGFILSQ